MLFSWFELIKGLVNLQSQSFILELKLYDYSVNNRTMEEQSHCDSWDDNIGTDHSLLMAYIIVQESVHVMPKMNESLIHDLHTRGSKFLFCSLNWRYIWNTTILLCHRRLFRKLCRSCTRRTNHCKKKTKYYLGLYHKPPLPMWQFPKKLTKYSWAHNIHRFQNPWVLNPRGRDPLQPSEGEQRCALVASGGFSEARRGAFMIPRGLWMPVLGK